MSTPISPSFDKFIRDLFGKMRCGLRLRSRDIAGTSIDRRFMTDDRFRITEPTFPGGYIERPRDTFWRVLRSLHERKIGTQAYVDQVNAALDQLIKATLAGKTRQQVATLLRDLAEDSRLATHGLGNNDIALGNAQAALRMAAALDGNGQ